jgi:putative ABC transport system ATP-binding protein
MDKIRSNGSQPHPLMLLKGIGKTFRSSAGEFEALKAIDLTFEAGEFAAVIGKSGSGKSTLLNIITGIDRPTSGEVVVNGTALGALNENQLAIWRGKNIGVIFQFFQLLPTLTVIENVMLPMDFGGFLGGRERKKRALELLALVGVEAQAYKLPNALSGGEQQRVAIARALANDPPILVADEPTGNLDTHTSDAILGLFSELVEGGKTVLMVTHERDVTAWVSRTITLADGRIVADTQREEVAYVQPEMA